MVYMMRVEVEDLQDGRQEQQQLAAVLQQQQASEDKMHPIVPERNIVQEFSNDHIYTSCITYV